MQAYPGQPSFCHTCTPVTNSKPNMCKDEIVGAQTTLITRHFTLELCGLFHKRARGGCLPPVVALGQCVLACHRPASQKRLAAKWWSRCFAASLTRQIPARTTASRQFASQCGCTTVARTSRESLLTTNVLGNYT